jgi:hypothetical protein
MIIFLTMFGIIFFTTSFDLWMSKRAYDIFVVVINFVGSNW